MDYIYGNIDAKIIDSGDMKFKTVSATVDNNEGTPEVVVDYDYINADLNLAFHNLKGDTGKQGIQGVGIESIRFNEDYTLTIILTNGEEYTTESIRGAKGDTGPAGPLQGSVQWDQVEGFPSEDFVSHEDLEEVSEELELKADISDLDNYVQSSFADETYSKKSDLEAYTTNEFITENYYNKMQTNELFTNEISSQEPEKIPTNQAVIEYVNSIIEPINNRLVQIENGLRGL